MRSMLVINYHSIGIDTVLRLNDLTKFNTYVTCIAAFFIVATRGSKFIRVRHSTSWSNYKKEFTTVNVKVLHINYLSVLKAACVKIGISNTLYTRCVACFEQLARTNPPAPCPNCRESRVIGRFTEIRGLDEVLRGVRGHTRSRNYNGIWCFLGHSNLLVQCHSIIVLLQILSETPYLSLSFYKKH